MMDLSEITIRDKELFDNHLRNGKHVVSELTFTNFFIWRNYYKFRYTVYKEVLWVISVPENGEPFVFMPLGGVPYERFAEAIEQLKNYFNKNGWMLKFKRVSEDYLPYFKKLASSETDIIHDRDNSDYLYISENLINLKGKKYDGKRNHISKFKKNYEFEYVSLEESLIQESIDFMYMWFSQRDIKEDESAYFEKLAITELLENYSKLDCKGALIRVDGICEAFTIGEMLNDETAVIHIEKANSKVNGLYTFINQQFCEHEWKNVKYINREQDLGIDGLRKAKLSYNPVALISKYTINII
jgi:uncharacterized protein